MGSKRTVSLIAGLVTEDVPDCDGKLVHHGDLGPPPATPGGDAPAVSAEVAVFVPGGTAAGLGDT